MVLLIPIIINALILSAAIWIVARHEADFEWWKLVGVSFGISVVGEFVMAGVAAGVEAMGLDGILGLITLLGGWAIIYVGISAWIISNFLYVMFRDAIVASIVYLVAKIAIQVGFYFAARAALGM